MIEKDLHKEEWTQSPSHVFWGEIAPSDHLVQIYDNDDVVLDSLEGFVESGIKGGDSVIIIATAEHLEALNHRIAARGVDVQQLQSTHQYIPLDAHETLAKFMKDGWPDDELFNKTVKEVIVLARGKHNRKVRAYGEMVAILWGQGHNGATVQLEHLWNKFCMTETFCLFCAYPKSGFTQDAHESLEHICSTHTMMISGLEKSKTEIFYKSSQRKNNNVELNKMGRANDMEELEHLKNQIKDLQASERELSQQVKELRDFVENASIPLHWVNGSGIVIWVNQVELDLLGYKKEEYINQHISKFHADKPVIEDILKRLINKETLLNYPARLLCKNGAIKHVLINSNVYWENGEFIHTRCFTRDITEIKAKELEQAALIRSLQQKINQLEKERA